GIIADAILLIDRIGADLWVVQHDTRGPFAELSRLPATLVDRVTAVPGVARAREFVYHTIQRQYQGRPLRLAVVGLSWPTDRGAWLPHLSGRPLAHHHYEFIADRTLGLSLGTRLVLGKETYTVVGLTTGMVSSGGDGLAFMTRADAQVIQADVAGEAVRLERAARRARAERLDLTHQQPALLERAAAHAAEIPALSPAPISAVLVSLFPGASLSTVRQIMTGWQDVSVYTHEEQRGFLLQGTVDKVQRQIGLFRLLLTIISAIIMALILYTMTLDKVQAIALLKLIGAPNRLLLGLIPQQALLLGALGYGVAYLLGQWIFPRFPRRVLIMPDDLLQLAVIVLGISVLASVLGMWKALRVAPHEALAG
ncbi:MAG: ABC transporter permease, partial [Candidatus Tectomicrobia bacterium]|nr:ABC transporter permease [Candidatus Tectomicrobia bacterium]